MEDKIKELLMEIIYKRFEKRLAFWLQVELENFIEISAQEIVKLFAIPDVSNSLDLYELEHKLDDALVKETKETLAEWIKQQRQ